MTGERGFTLVEMLLAVAILAVALTALAGLFASSNRALRTGQMVSERQQEAEAAGQLLQYELSLAGYRGVGANDLENNHFTGPTLRITKASSEADSDQIRVQYFEDRFTADGGYTLTQVIFSVAQDGDGALHLFRQQGAGEAQAVVPGIDLLKVVKYLSRSGDITNATTSAPIPDDLTAISVELTFDDGRVGRLIMGFNNPQTTELVVY